MRSVDIELTPFVPQRDLALLELWLTRPHVSRWWGDPLKALREVSEPPAGGGEASRRVFTKSLITP